jgi:hypothetical protein
MYFFFLCSCGGLNKREKEKKREIRRNARGKREGKRSKTKEEMETTIYVTQLSCPCTFVLHAFPSHWWQTIVA